VGEKKEVEKEKNAGTGRGSDSLVQKAHSDGRTKVGNEKGRIGGKRSQGCRVVVGGGKQVTSNVARWCHCDLWRKKGFIKNM